MKSLPIKEPINFGNIAYFPGSLEIVRDNESYTLPPIPSKILNLLISHSGQYVSRQKIIETAWPSSKVVSDESFYQTIKRLRQLLGDTAEPRQYIINSRTNHYMLKPTVRITASSNPISVAYKGLLGLGFVIMCALIIWLNTSDIRYQRVDDTVMTSIQGQNKNSVISPDRSIIVFEHKAPNNGWWNLKAKRLNSEKYVNLVVGKPGIYNTEPDFSPSGKRLVWVMTDYQSVCQLMVAEFDPLNLSLSNQEPILDCAQAYYARSPKWKTENSLYIALSTKLSQTRAIFEIDLTTKERIKINSTVGVGNGDYKLFFNSSNNKIAHLRHSDAYEAKTVLMVYDIELKTDIILKSYISGPYTAAWFDQTRILVKGDKGLEVVSLDGQSILIDAERIEEEYIFSMGDNRFGFVRGPLYSGNIHLIDLINHAQNKVKYSSASHESRAVIARESNEVAFSSKRNGYRQIFVTVDQAPVQITHFTVPVLLFDLAISPYGRYVAFHSGGDLYVVDNSGELIYKTKVAVSGISFSPDGHYLLFGSEKLTDETMTESAIKQLNLSDLSESILTDGFMPKAADDGIYFFRRVKASNTPILYKINNQGEVVELFESPFNIVDSTSFDIIGEQLLYAQPDKDRQTLVSRNIITDEITEISPLQTTKFSINKNMTLLVTNPKSQVQNNLAAFTLKTSD